MTIKENHNQPLPFRAPEITQEQLRQLRRKWGENRSRVIIRCIERTWQEEFGRQQDDIDVKEKRKT